MTDYSGTLTLASDRFAEHVVLSAIQSNTDNAANTWTLAVDPQVGDVLVLELQMRVNGITTFPSYAEQWPSLGLAGWITDAQGGGLDLVGVAQWFIMDGGSVANGVSAWLNPDEPVMLRTGERLFLEMPQLENDPGDTADMYVAVRARRLRTPSSG